MKKIVLFLLVAINMNAQKITENKVDEFTHDTITRSSWEVLNRGGGFVSFYRIVKINSRHYLDMKMMLMNASSFTIWQDNKLMVKIDSSEPVVLKSIETKTSCTGCGARGFSGAGAQGVGTSYKISEEDLMRLRDSKLLKVRIYLSDSYVENDLDEKSVLTIKETINLFLPK